MSLLSLKDNVPEGEIFYRWARSRIESNKNVIVATTGPTGSGKSLNDLRKAEIIHRRTFKEEFPIENCCFSIAELIKRISSGTLRKGEVLILEEAGVNAGSADWQNKVVKMFNYVLQSFRSMNIILFMNLPVLTMLSKQARQLVHMHIETKGIDYETNELKVKALYHQLNQHSGQSFWKFLRIHLNGKRITVNKMKFKAPSDALREKYEIKKAKFLSDLTCEFTKELEVAEKAKLDKLSRNDLTETQLDVFNKYNMGLSVKDLAEYRGTSESAVYLILRSIKKKGYSLGKADFEEFQAKKRGQQLNIEV
jgi:hypothetical protein